MFFVWHLGGLRVGGSRRRLQVEGDAKGRLHCLGVVGQHFLVLGEFQSDFDPVSRNWAFTWSNQSGTVAGASSPWITT